MKIKSSILFKVALLIMVFLLNTVVGFACSLGTDMSFNTEHHEHGQAKSDHHTSKQAKDNCCKDEVAKILKSDQQTKPIVYYNFQSLTFLISPVFYYADPVVNFIPDNSSGKYFAHHCRPPISDIRIAIQSFQI